MNIRSTISHDFKPDKEGKIIGINIHTLKHFKTNPKNVCGHNNLYRIGNNDHSYEKHLARLEGVISNDYPKSDAKYMKCQRLFRPQFRKVKTSFFFEIP